VDAIEVAAGLDLLSVMPLNVQSKARADAGPTNLPTCLAMRCSRFSGH
jgi:hypothetical protein